MVDILTTASVPVAIVYLCYKLIKSIVNKVLDYKLTKYAIATDLEFFVIQGNHIEYTKNALEDTK